MSRFHGPQPGFKTDRGMRRNGPKGSLRAYRATLREEAENRLAAYRKKKEEENGTDVLVDEVSGEADPEETVGTAGNSGAVGSEHGAHRKRARRKAA